MRVLAFLFFSYGLFGQMVWFEPNRGQVSGRTAWIGRSKGAYLYITGNEVVYANKQNIHMRLVGASKRAAVEGAEPTGGYSSYFTGRDEKTWFTGIPHYAKLRYENVYPGIDILYYASGRNVEYDFIVKPGADPGRIEIAFSEPVRLDHGDLLVAGLRQHRPRVLQDGHEIQAAYRLTENGHAQVALADYDRLKDLIVDPVLEFSTYLGGPGEDRLNGLATDSNGYIYAAGDTQSPSAPGLDPFHQANVVALTPIVLKLTPDASRVMFYVELSANGWDYAKSIAVDSSGNIVLMGSTRSPTFPLKNPAQTVFKAGVSTTFVSKLAPDGKSLLYSTYLGGSYWDYPGPVVIDDQGNAYFSGSTLSKDFPTTADAYQTKLGGLQNCYFVKISRTGALLYSTYLGGDGLDSCLGMVRDVFGNMLIAGGSTGNFPLRNPMQSEWTPRTGYQTPVLVKFSADGKLISSSYFGGRVSGAAWSIVADSNGGVYVAGRVSSGGFESLNALQPDYPGGTSGFFAKLDAGLSRAIYASYFGASNSNNLIESIGVDSKGFVYLCGIAGGIDFPQKDALQNWKGGGAPSPSDGLIAKLTPSGSSLVYSTSFGGTSVDECSAMAPDGRGGVVIAGVTSSLDFPIKNGYQPNSGGGYDGFLAKISDATPPPASPLTVTPGQMVFRYTQASASPPAQTATVSGGSFTVATSASWINVASSSATVSVSVDSSGLVPGSYGGTITLSPANGTPTNIAVTLGVFALAPVLTSVTPSFVAIGAQDTVVTIQGSGFQANSSVTVDGNLWDVSPIQFVSSSMLKFSLPPSYFTTSYTHSIAVQNPNSAPSNVLALAVGSPAPSFSAASVTNAASYVSGPVAPGEIVTIFGTNLSGAATFDSFPATIIYSSSTQMSVTVPYSILGPDTNLKIGDSVPVSLPVVPSAPGIFAAVTASDGMLTLYATGCGALSGNALPRCVAPVAVTVNGVEADVLYAGIAPGLPEGADQINIKVPDGLSGPVQIVLKAGDAVSKPFSFTLP